MELADGGDMLDLLQALKHPLSEEKARAYYLQFGDALRYMHSVVSGGNFNYRSLLKLNVSFSMKHTGLCPP